MKVNFPHLAALIFSILLGIYAIFYLSSCSPQYHHNKAEKKGYVYSCDTVKIEVPVTIQGKDGEDSLIYVRVKVPCPDVETPKTNTEIRNERKSEKDSLKHVERMYKLRYNFIIDSLQKENKRLKIEVNTNIKIEKQETKQIKQATKKEKKTRWKLWLLIGFFVGLLFSKLFHDFKGMFNLPIENR
jgi:hypothetical protein